MDPIDGLSENYLGVVAAYAAATVIVACYILFDWGDEPIPQELTLVGNLLRQAHLHQLFFGR